jgi:hypothetical protein
MHDSKDESRRRFLDLDFIKFIVEKADLQIYVLPIMTKFQEKNSVMLGIFLAANTVSKILQEANLLLIEENSLLVLFNG